MGDPKRPPSSMEWDATLGGMLKHGTRVRRVCKVCDKGRYVDIPQMIARYGTAFTLWDFYEDCTTCADGLTLYHAQPGPSTPYRPLCNYLVLKGPDGWEWFPMFPSIPPFSHGIRMPRP